MIEIERKFLVNHISFDRENSKKTYIKQGFLNTHKERTVRVRIRDDKGYLTIKGISSTDGMSRFEWEKEISLEDAQNLMLLCEEGFIEKTRFEIPFGNHVYEVDEFYGNHEGLIVAEIELNDANESFEKPNWLGKEVTGDVKYYNSFLSKHPYKK